jgi:hypothetical protein
VPKQTAGIVKIRTMHTTLSVVRVLNPWAHAADALASGAAYLAKHGDGAKVAKHACHDQAQGAQFLPASFSVLGAWGPAITARFDALWATEILGHRDSEGGG